MFVRYKNGTKLEERDNLKFEHVNGTHELKITKPKVADIGTYSCGDSMSRSNANFRVSSKSLFFSLKDDQDLSGNVEHIFC